MKKMLQIVLAVIIIYSAWLFCVEASNRQIIEMGNMDEDYAVSFSIPNNTSVTNPDTLFAALVETATKTSSNIFRTVLTDGENGGYELVKFALLSEESEYMTCFNLTDGRYLTISETQSDSDVFLSTEDTGDDSQIGVIYSDMMNFDVTIYPLYKQFSYYKADGIYYVELADGVTLQYFLETLRDSIESVCDVALSINDFEGGNSIIGMPYIDTFFYYLLLSGLVFFYFLLLIYQNLRDIKSISVMKLFGMENRRILKKNMLPFLVEGSTVLFVIAMLLLKKGGRIGVFVPIFMKTLIIYIAVFMGMTIAEYLIIRCRNIAEGLKGNREGSIIYLLNVVMKTICICVVLYCGQIVYQDICDSITLLNQLSGWEYANNYGVFYPLKIGYDTSETEQIEMDKTINYDLYEYLNDLGALYIDATQYEKEYQELNSYIDEEWMFNVTVNPNYLLLYSLTDENGEVIDISEEDTDWVLLVPQKYKSEEDEILSYYELDRTNCLEICESYYGIDCDQFDDQSVRIVWLENDQKIFTFSPNIGVDQSGWIENPVVFVMTNSNATIVSRQYVRGNGDSDPLKIPINVDSSKTYQNLLPVLDELKLSDNLTAVVSINESITSQLLQARMELETALLMAAVGLGVLLFVTVQNTILHFDHNRKKYIVKKIYGISSCRIYRQYFVTSSVIYVVILSVFSIVSENENRTFFILAGLGLIIVQVVVSYTCIHKLEMRRISDILKGA